MNSLRGFMDFFSSMLKDGLKYSENLKYFDVTSSITGKNEFEGVKSLHIDSSHDVKIHAGSSELTARIFLTDKERVKKVKFSSDLQGTLLNLQFSADDDTRGYLEVSIPSLNEVSVESENSDLLVDKVDVKKISVETKSGDILVKLSSNDCDIDAKSKNGDVRVEGKVKHHASDRTLICRSKNGDILVQAK
jgi:DUF4097 and DUF4098 domain-containing protein YvlB